MGLFHRLSDDVTARTIVRGLELVVVIRRPLNMAMIRNSILAAVSLAAATGLAALPSYADGGAKVSAKVLAPLKAGRFDIGSKKALAYYQSDRNTCKVTVILAQPFDESRDYAHATNEAVRFNTAVAAGTSTRVETAEGPALALWCSPTAATLFVQTVDRVAYVAPAQ